MLMWNDLTIQEKGEVMRMALNGGITSLGAIKSFYDNSVSASNNSQSSRKSPYMADAPWTTGRTQKKDVKPPLRSTQATQNTASKSSPSKGYIYDVLPALLREAGLNVRVTSGYRTKSPSGRFSHHHTHNAVDIIPTGNTTFEDIERVVYSNPTIYNYMLSNGIGLLDETARTASSRATMKKTGATGSHFHFGPDTAAAQRYRQAMINKGVELPSSIGYTVTKNNPPAAAQGTDKPLKPYYIEDDIWDSINDAINFLGEKEQQEEQQRWYNQPTPTIAVTTPNQQAQFLNDTKLPSIQEEQDALLSTLPSTSVNGLDLDSIFSLYPESQPFQLKRSTDFSPYSMFNN